MRSIKPCFTLRTWRRGFQISNLQRFEFFLRYRSATSGIKSETLPSCTERSSLMYSACAHISGMAEPVGRPQYIQAEGRSGPSHDCSGNRPVSEASFSIA